MQPYPKEPINNGRNFCKTIHTDTYPEIDPTTKSDHTGHYVLITGASKGVGYATAISFAKAGAAAIAIAARSDFGTLEDGILSAAKSAGKSAPKVLKLQMDVLNYDSIEAAANKTSKEFGKLDILINNAGYLSSFETIAKADPGEWWKNYEVNLRGVAWVSKALLPLLLSGGEKTIVNVSSLGAHAVVDGASGYQGSKFALLRLTEALMADHGMEGLLAYTVHPCGAPTELARGMPSRMNVVLTDQIEIASDTMCFLTQTRREWLAGRFISCPWDMPEFLGKEKEIVEGDKLKMRMVW